MSVPIVRSLILKDLYLLRWMIVGAIVAGVFALAAMPLSRALGYVGGVSLICTLIVLNIMLVMYGVVQERKEKILVFIMSLPVSVAQYTAAKVASTTIAFVGPWLLLTIATVVLIDVSRIPNGLLPYWLAILGYLLFYFCALLAVSLVSESTAWHAAAITLGNISVNFLIAFLLSRPSVTAHADGPIAVWTADILGIIAAEMVAGVAAVAVAAHFHSRRSDFV